MSAFTLGTMGFGGTGWATPVGTIGVDGAREEIAIAKEAGKADWSRGWTYLWNFVRPYALYAPLAAVAAIAYLGWRRLEVRLAMSSNAPIAMISAPTATPAERPN